MHDIYDKPWGTYEIIASSDSFQSKVIIVKPNQKLSLQSHKHREEHWIIVKGEGMVQLDKSFIPVKIGCSVFIPKGENHRITNAHNTEELIFIEVQIGSYLGEDDIVRYEDIYGRL